MSTFSSELPGDLVTNKRDPVINKSELVINKSELVINKSDPAKVHEHPKEQFF